MLSRLLEYMMQGCVYVFIRAVVRTSVRHQYVVVPRIHLYATVATSIVQKGPAEY